MINTKPEAQQHNLNYILPRMHSSRMRTVRLLTVSQHALPGGVPAGGVNLPSGGCTCLGVGGVPAWGWGVYLPGGVPAWGVYLPGVCVYLPGGCVPAQGVPAQVLLPVNRMTDRCKNITFPQTSLAGGNKLFLEKGYRINFIFRRVRLRLTC